MYQFQESERTPTKNALPRGEGFGTGTGTKAIQGGSGPDSRG